MYICVCVCVPVYFCFLWYWYYLRISIYDYICIKQNQDGSQLVIWVFMSSYTFKYLEDLTSLALSKRLNLRGRPGHNWPLDLCCGHRWKSAHPQCVSFSDVQGLATDWWFQPFSNIISGHNYWSLNVIESLGIIIPFLLLNIQII